MKRGKYSKVSRSDGVRDFLNQLKKEDGAEMSAPELPVSSIMMMMVMVMMMMMIDDRCGDDR